MIKLASFFLFLYLLIAYSIRWFVVSNSPEFIKHYGKRTVFTDFFNRLFSAVFLFFLEYCSYVIALSLLIADYFYHYVILFFKPKKTLPSASASYEKPPILLIHGYMMRGWVLMYIKKRLQKDGWDDVHAWSYIPPFKNIPYYAEQLKIKVDDILKETDQRKIVLIGHSMGGLLARYYISHLQGKSNVERLITLGTPHQGTQLWSFSYSPCGKDMRPKSNFLKKLKSLPVDIKTLSIYSSFDEIVLPYQSSKLNGKNVQNKEFDDLGHMRLIFSPKVYEEILTFLLEENHLDKKIPK